jgi:hypothetical protein
MHPFGVRELNGAQSAVTRAHEAYRMPPKGDWIACSTRHDRREHTS